MHKDVVRARFLFEGKSFEWESTVPVINTFKQEICSPRTLRGLSQTCKIWRKIQDFLYKVFFQIASFLFWNLWYNLVHFCKNAVTGTRFDVKNSTRWVLNVSFCAFDISPRKLYQRTHKAGYREWLDLPLTWSDLNSRLPTMKACV